MRLRRTGAGSLLFEQVRISSSVSVRTAKYSQIRMNPLTNVPGRSSTSWVRGKTICKIGRVKRVSSLDFSVTRGIRVREPDLSFTLLHRMCATAAFRSCSLKLTYQRLSVVRPRQTRGTAACIHARWPVCLSHYLAWNRSHPGPKALLARSVCDHCRRDSQTLVGSP
jgi:hypothetical protein